MNAPQTDVDDELSARVAWSRVIEPGDGVAGELVRTLGAGRALAWARSAATSRDVPMLVKELVDNEPALDDVRRRLGTAVGRWAGRLADLDPARDLERMQRLGGGVLHPGSVGWPVGLDDLGPTAPMCLWVRGRLEVSTVLDRSIALVGARASTSYGERVAVELAAGLAAHSTCVVSGGAYGIDAAAHRGSLAAGGTTVALLAGGVDRAYPVGNAPLLERILEQGGSVLSEVPPGGVPSKGRFLMRNRLIAAVSRATVVVEAAWRSGALSTANHAVALLRPVGAVPGPVTSMASAGCHRLLRDGAAVCVTDAAEVLELAGRAGEDLAPERMAEAREGDDLDWVSRRLLDALPGRSAVGHEELARTAGLSVGEVRGALGVLELAGLTRRVGAGWARSVGRTTMGRS
ncbi:DNA-protecting protein DprA [Cellulomonas sp. WB94]|uniref:DNA-processing protein DprA n=1 Tax=Cellulomonas sp. WB94 TaxID=2173174 RepID=UPI000D576FF3|nr:DNA-processing protein DprA [Cellulomonas sp. WB94]PVU81864.1 DNA-protecting protein DprA [Cellulomonas sp. WB94]